EAIGELVEEERTIEPPAYLRQQVIRGFERQFTTAMEQKQVRRRGLRGLKDWIRSLLSHLHRSIHRPALVAAAILVVAGLVVTIILIRQDRLRWARLSHISDAGRMTPGPDAAGTGACQGGEALASSVFDYFPAVQPSGGGDFSETYTIYDELPDAVDAEYLLYVEGPADQLALQELLDPAAIVASEESGIDRLAVGDDGMVRAIQVRSLPQ
ncbi:MAG: hypothetical protein ACKOB4_11270, partial [Acidobacteriota bacterium]